MSHLEHLRLIEERPTFRGSLDNELLLKLSKKDGNTAHLLKRLSEETERGDWLIDRVIDLNNAAVENREKDKQLLEAISDLTETVKDQNRKIEALTKAQNDNSTITLQNQATILEWKQKFSGPLAILKLAAFSLIGIVTTALVTIYINSKMGAK